MQLELRLLVLLCLLSSHTTVYCGVEDKAGAINGVLFVRWHYLFMAHCVCVCGALLEWNITFTG